MFKKASECCHNYNTKGYKHSETFCSPHIDVTSVKPTVYLDMHESQASTSHWALGNALQVEKLHGLSKHCLLGVAPPGQPGKIKTWFDIYKKGIIIEETEILDIP